MQKIKASSCCIWVGSLLPKVLCFRKVCTAEILQAMQLEMGFLPSPKSFTLMYSVSLLSLLLQQQPVVFDGTVALLGTNQWLRQNLFCSAFSLFSLICPLAEAKPGSWVIPDVSGCLHSLLCALYFSVCLAACEVSPKNTLPKTAHSCIMKCVRVAWPSSCFPAVNVSDWCGVLLGPEQADMCSMLRDEGKS